MPPLPNVIGQKLKDAHQTLNGAGFTNHTHVDDTGAPASVATHGDEKVLKTDPVPRTDIPLDSVIRVVVEALDEVSR